MLVNNAGIEITDLIAEVKPEEIRRMLEVNILGRARPHRHGHRPSRRLRQPRPLRVPGSGRRRGDRTDSLGPARHRRRHRRCGRLPRL
ncbi:hypothetical protein [Nostocoides jenkinsii]|uniref:hypothetical protein n=1 Tax=Nostocoides jenkinsii TaxID=330834 RepID=UPI002AA2AAB9|nr:hypothetical protein [Tetrasphaera jenkinsii]